MSFLSGFWTLLKTFYSPLEKPTIEKVWKVCVWSWKTTCNFALWRPSRTPPTTMFKNGQFSCFDFHFVSVWVCVLFQFLIRTCDFFLNFTGRVGHWNALSVPPNVKTEFYTPFPRIWGLETAFPLTFFFATNFTAKSCDRQFQKDQFLPKPTWCDITFVCERSAPHISRNVVKNA